jgi:diguanylate cyclase (GGDEF)-like protein/PAS domain S-box-containing protein
VHGPFPVLYAAALLTAALPAFLIAVVAYRRQSIRTLTEKRYNVLESIPDGFYIVDEHWRFTHVNERAEVFLRKPASQLIGTRIHDVLDPLASELLPEMQTVRTHGVPLDRLQHFQSTNTWVELRIQPARDEVLVYLRDVTERKRAEMHSRESERRLRLLLTQLPAVLWTLDRDLRIASISGSDLAERGLREEELIGRPYESLMSGGEQKEMALSALRRALSGEAVRYETREDGRWMQNDVEPLRDADGHVIGAIGVSLDVTEVRETANRFAELARLDAMTQLPNRLALEERLPAILQEAEAKNECVAVLFVDVDRFKTINDTLGHRTGDELLRLVTRRLQQRLDGRATIYRPGGDEFVIVMDGIKHKRSVAALAMDVLSSFSEPYVVEGRELFVTSSVGASLFPQNARTADDLIAFADSAMYRAKESGRNNAKFYDGSMHAHVLERMGLEQDLRHALSRDELRLVFQPLVDTETRRIVGAETLVRWQHPLLGELGPQAFIPIAEENGAIVDITRWILREACRRAAQIRQTVAPDFRIAVNLSPRDLYESDLCDTLATVLAETGLAPEALDLEITENVMLNEISAAALTRIAALGVKLSVDDFGTGYSSLSYIKMLPIDTIKIDRTFIRDVARDSYDQGIVKAIAALGQSLGLRIVAEGIETETQWDFVKALHCQHVQGFYFYRPLLWTDLVDTLQCVNQQAAVANNRGNVIQLYGTK